jgi:regulator of cell morphogenesis and NO signaling
MIITPDTTVGALATAFPETIRVFQRLRIEFCCDGTGRLGDLCRERGLAFETVAAALEAARSVPSPVDRTWRTRPLVELTSHITEAFHEPLKEELPRLHTLAVRAQNHRHNSHAALSFLLHGIARLEAELEPHMAIEEIELFPLIERLETASPGDGDRQRFERLRTVVERGHTEIGQILPTLARVTDRYATPADACATVSSLYRGMAELDKLLQLHVHLENNLLFPRASALLAAARIERSK